MARQIPPDRLPAVLDAAARVFITHGYRRAQMQDVADALGLAKGTLYGYARSKEALFTAAVRYADDAEPLPDVAALPVPVPGPGELAELVAARLAAEVPEMALTRALARPDPPATAQDAVAELSDVVVDLYLRLADHRVAIKLVDRCAPELPDLARVWFGAGRGAQMSAMETYLRQRAATGALWLPGPTAVVARTVVDMCVMWAVHCPFDPAPPDTALLAADTGDETVAATLAQMFARALIADHPPTTDPGGTQ
jgi:AcrR family transcriptional regulator